MVRTTITTEFNIDTEIMDSISSLAVDNDLSKEEMLERAITYDMGDETEHHHRLDKIITTMRCEYMEAVDPNGITVRFGEDKVALVIDLGEGGLSKAILKE